MTDSTRRRNNPFDIRPGPAYPQGPRRPKRGELPPADPDNMMGPAAPGAVRSPQVPGQVPDRSSIPGHGKLPVPKATRSIRPLTEFGSAQRIMRVFEVKTGQEDNPARWEQATASYEELRKADPSLLTPLRPGPGFNLAEGDVDISMLPDSEGNAPALPAGVPPQEGLQKVSPSDATVPNQAKAADAPAPGDAVGTGGTLAAAKDDQPQGPSGKGPTIAPQ